MPVITLENGLELYYRKSGTGEKTLLLIHGNLASSRWWERVIAALPDEYRVVAPDLRGCGESTEPDAPSWSMGELAADLREFCEALGLTKVTAVGHSLGGSLALQLAADAPGLVDRAVVINPGPLEGLQLSDAHYAQLEILAGQPSIMRTALAVTMPTAPEDAFRHGLLEDSIAKSLGAWLRHGRAVNVMDLHTRAAEISMPVLVIYGTMDNLITRPMMDRMAAALPQATLEIWEGVGHSAPVEAPQRLAERIVAFAEG